MSPGMCILQFPNKDFQMFWKMDFPHFQAYPISRSYKFSSLLLMFGGDSNEKIGKFPVIPEAHSEPNQTFKIELFTKIV